MTGPALTRRKPTFSALFCPVLALAVFGTSGVWFSGVAHAAQPGAGPGGGAGPIGPAGGGPGQGRKEKKDGPAEEAEKDKEALRPIEPVPATPRRFRRVQLFELNGYMRMRGDYFHRLNLGLSDVLDEGDRPTRFFAPPAESVETDEDGMIISANQADCLTRLQNNGASVARAATRCRRRQGVASANMRLRMEPTIHVTDTVKVHAQVDFLDNVVLGSTPDSYGYDFPGAPIDLYTRTQLPPSAGQNTVQDSVLVKRGWGEIKFGWGLGLEFGRMPWSWGMGVVANHGNGYARLEKADIIRHLDRDFGDSVDSVRLSFDAGKDRRKTHKIALSWDWASSGPTTAQLLGPEYASGGTVGQAFSVEKYDNVYQWSASVQRRDETEMLKRKLSLGNPVVNYGVIAWLRYQDVDDALPDPAYPIQDLQDYTNRLVHRRALVATPDLWFRVNWRTLRVELEAAGSFGRFNVRDIDADLTSLGEGAALDNLSSLDPNSDLLNKTVATFGYALEFKYGFFNDRFHIGLDQGLATGDTAAQVDANPTNPLNTADNGALNNFRFNPAFNIDLLMFREVLGTVSNAAYFKPWAAFYFFDHFSARVDIEYAMAARRQSTLGNRWSYGIELDGGLRYHDAREPIFFQIQYGVMFPLPAFNRIRLNVPVEDARAAQTVQGQLGIKF